MDLLNPNEIREQKSESIMQSQWRTKKLSEEEARLTKNINLARENTKIEIAKLDSELLEHKNKTNVEKTKLTQEVSGLRAEKAKLFKPIDDIKKQADEQLAQAKILVENLRKEQKVIDEAKEKIQEEVENNRDRAHELDDRNLNLNQREQKVIIAEERLRLSTVNLNTEWANYHKSVDKNNEWVKSLDQREAELNTREKTLDIKTEEQKKTAKKLIDEKRAIASGYQALADAKKHLGITP
jgi:hypothetical protein